LLILLWGFAELAVAEPIENLGETPHGANPTSIELKEFLGPRNVGYFEIHEHCTANGCRRSKLSLLSIENIDGQVVENFRVNPENSADPASSRAYQLRYDVDGNLHAKFMNYDWHLILLNPVQDGLSWLASDMVHTWHKIDGLSTRLGYFDTCFEELQRQPGAHSPIVIRTVLCQGGGAIFSTFENERFPEYNYTSTTIDRGYEVP
jgi:hypothetical protein